MSKIAILVATLALASFGCGDSSGDGSQAVTIQFAGVVGMDDFACGDTYDNLGANDTSLKLTDFRFYVQDVEVQNTDAEWISVEAARTTGSRS